MTSIEKFDLRAERVRARLTVARTNLPNWSDEARPRVRDELLRAGRFLDSHLVAIGLARQKFRVLQQKVTTQQRVLEALDKRSEGVAAERVRIGDVALIRVRWNGISPFGSSGTSRTRSARLQPVDR